MSSAIAWVFVLAMSCAAGGLLLWGRGIHKRDMHVAKQFFERRTQRPEAASWIAAELDDLMRRSNVQNPRAALTLWALITGVVSFVCSTCVAPALGFVAVVFSALCFVALLVRRAQKRRVRIVRQLPSFLEEIVRRVTNGDSVPAAFQSAAAHTQAPLAECLEQVMPRLRNGMDIDQALATVARIYRVQEFELIGAVLRISIKFGGRADVMLERMASFMRELERADGEPVAMSTEARLSSWALGLLPALFGGALIVLNPEYFQSMWADTLGRRLVYGALGLQALGAYLLYRLARQRS
ncbi:type II secretion system F family protein [Caballeronia insecticola]|uniref:Type II secretion system protein n=1 Tax=Caballeronia insecticola TaxID=758793 RepID=R4X3L3_9BURK|nr:type II secretion system F family protein [Caballeronia insecticola]BAN27511.1 type II secretion system protein [Caballeronia insecticola]